MRRGGRGRKALLALAAVLLALAGAEGVLRIVYSDLPSLAALDDADLELKPFLWSDYPHGENRRVDADLTRCSDFPVPAVSPPEQRFGPARNKDELRLWVVGDSVAGGVGIPRGKDFGSLLARRLAGQLGRRVKMVNLAIDGAGFCEMLSRLDGALRLRPPPHLVLLQLFADDLEARAMVAVGGRIVALPDRAREGMVRALVSRSYLANLAWVSALAQAPPRPSRFIDREGLQLFKSSISEVHARLRASHVELVTLLVAPAGLHLCPKQPPPGSRCGWLGHDQDLIARTLEEAEVDFVDLRSIWKGRGNMVIQEERLHMANGQGMGVHPNSEGHALISQRVWPVFEKAAAAARRGSALTRK